jgi:GNAT superfamily N-acetyltransferase
VTPPRIATVGEDDLEALLPLMRGYCDFYEAAPSDEDLLAMSRALIADHEREGVQFIAYDDGGTALGFATIFWTWSTSRAARIATMNDLFVAQGARGRRVGEALIERCLEAVRRRGGAHLEWQTALDNTTAQALYDRIGAKQERWLDYSLEAARPQDD